MTKRKTRTRARTKTRRPRGRVYQIKNPTCVPGPEAVEAVEAIRAGILPLPTPEVAAFDLRDFKIDLSSGPFSVKPADVPMKRVTKTIKWPATWWDHLKQDLFPISWQLRWPPRYEEVTYWTEVVDRDACPSNPFASELLGKPAGILMGTGVDFAEVRSE